MVSDHFLHSNRINWKWNNSAALRRLMWNRFRICGRTMRKPFQPFYAFSEISDVGLFVVVFSALKHAVFCHCTVNVETQVTQELRSKPLPSKNLSWRTATITEQCFKLLLENLVSARTICIGVLAQLWNPDGKVFPHLVTRECKDPHFSTINMDLPSSQWTLCSLHVMKTVLWNVYIYVRVGEKVLYGLVVGSELF